MTTVFEQLCIYAKEKNTFILHENLRRALGYTVLRKWKETTGAQQLNKVLRTDQLGTEFYVLEYPLTFAEEMQSVIHDFYIRLHNKHRIKKEQVKPKPEQQTQPKRKRKPIQKPEFSSKTILNK